MKKKLIVLASTALFAVGLAFYANYSNTMNVLGDSNVEALSDNNDGGSGSGNSGPVTYGIAPKIVTVDQSTHIVEIADWDNVKDKNGNDKNDCHAVTGEMCRLSTATPISNAQDIVGMVTSVLNAAGNMLPTIVQGLANFVVGLFK